MLTLSVYGAVETTQVFSVIHKAGNVVVFVLLCTGKNKMISVKKVPPERIEPETLGL